MRLETPEISWHSADPIYGVTIQPINIGLVDVVQKDETLSYRVATGAADKLVRIWRFIFDDETAASSTPENKDDSYAGNVHFVCELTAHQSSVNCVRFSPVRQVLASASDDRVIILWRREDTRDSLTKTSSSAKTITSIPMQAREKNLMKVPSTDNPYAETWKAWKFLRGHLEGVYDLAWSFDGSKLASCSVDNTSIIWFAAKSKAPHSSNEDAAASQAVVGKSAKQRRSANTSIMLKKVSDSMVGQKAAVLAESKGYVQGCVWDPKNQFFMTLAGDRAFRVYDTNLFNCKAKITKLSSKIVSDFFPPPQSPMQSTNSSNSGSECPPPPVPGISLFADNMTVKSFYRKLDVSPDGVLLAIPSIQLPVAPPTNDSSSLITFSTMLYLTGKWSSPLCYLPSASGKATFCARFCPQPLALYTKSQMRASFNPLRLSYRWALAVATLSDIIIYDTQIIAPIAFVSNLHFDQLTDLSWSPDGRFLMISATDGYCSLLRFEPGELGTPYTGELASLCRLAAPAPSLTPLKESKTVNTVDPSSVTDANGKVTTPVTKKSRKRRQKSGGENACPDSPGKQAETPKKSKADVPPKPATPKQAPIDFFLKKMNNAKAVDGSPSLTTSPSSKFRASAISSPSLHAVDRSQEENDKIVLSPPSKKQPSILSSFTKLATSARSGKTATAQPVISLVSGDEEDSTCVIEKSPNVMMSTAAKTPKMNDENDRTSCHQAASTSVTKAPVALSTTTKVKKRVALTTISSSPNVPPDTTLDDASRQSLLSLAMDPTNQSSLSTFPKAPPTESEPTISEKA